MGWQAGDCSQPGEMPSRDSGLPARLAGFEHGGAWEAAPPSALLAAALQAAAGPQGDYDGADTDALVGIARQWAAIESWAVAGLLGALRAMMGEDDAGTPLLRRRSDLPAGWDDSLNYEIAAALAMGPVSAGNLAGLAWALGTRLPSIGRLLADGTLTRAKAKLVVQTFEPLDEGEAARAEALILGELADKTYFQVERLAWRAALAVAPDIAERRRSAAERERARVTVFREESGAVGLSGRDLPAAPALSGHANVLARAQLYEASGAFEGQRSGGLQALAYLHLLNGVSAEDAIAFARADVKAPDSTRHSGDGDDWDPPGEPDRGSGNHDDDSPSDDQGPDAGGDPDDDHGPDAGGDPDDDHGPGGTGGNPDDDQGPDAGGDPGDDHGPDAGGDPDDDHGPGGTGGNPGHGPGPDGVDAGPSGKGARPGMPELTVPLLTLQRQAERPGDSRLLGPLDPAAARDLAAAAVRSPGSRWEVIVVDAQGYAVGHGIARRAPRQRHQAMPERPTADGLPAQVNITVTEALLSHLAAHSAEPRSGTPPGDWALLPCTNGVWTLLLPGGQELTLRLDVVPTHTCDHRFQVNSYAPGSRLRRLVQVRDHQCTFPTCSRPARESDFEHAKPYHEGGRTDACNAGARSRRCHQVKQSPGWTVTQPRPGWHVWTTPTGRSYVQQPWRYIA